MQTGLVAEEVAGEGNEIEEDKIIAIVELKSAADMTANKLGRIDVEEDEEVPPGTLIAVVLEPAETLEDAPELRTPVQLGGADDESTSGEGRTGR